MLLSQTAEHALRAMACLAQAAPDMLNSGALAAQAQIPGHYVSKVMRQLVVAGLVEARKGRSGGFRLAHAPADITFASILEAVGDQVVSDRCAFGLSACNLDNPCPLHPAWRGLKEVFEGWARSTTLADASQPAG